MRRAYLFVLLMVGVMGYSLAASTAVAAPIRDAPSTQSPTTATYQITVEGKTYFAQPGHELTIPLHQTAKTGDTKGIPAAVHILVGVGARSTITHNGPRPQDSYACDYNGGKAWFSDAVGITLGSYQLVVSFCADVTTALITSYHRDTDTWYANTGLAWYFNSRLNVNTTLNRRDATVASTIHFTGPFFQTENVEVAVDMHAFYGYETNAWRWYVFGGDPVIK